MNKLIHQRTLWDAWKRYVKEEEVVAMLRDKASRQTKPDEFPQEEWDKLDYFEKGFIELLFSTKKISLPIKESETNLDVRFPREKEKLGSERLTVCKDCTFTFSSSSCTDTS